jgi:hypothetical protein
MPIANRQSAAERLRHYGRKCDQHLSRVRLSHLLALDGLRIDAAGLALHINDLVRASFEEVQSDLRDMKLRRGLHEVHLIALKADFELYLNRVLTVVWTAHFASLADKAPGKRDVSLRQLAEAAVHGNAGRDFVIQMVVPEHGLTALVGTLKEATGIELPRDLPAYDFAQWSQIQVAFDVRHLIEHRDGRVDSDFRAHVKKFWSNSSWGKRNRLPDLLDRITVEEADVGYTYDAMRDAARLLTEALVRWDSQQPTPDDQQSGENAESSESA